MGVYMYNNEYISIGNVGYAMLYIYMHSYRSVTLVWIDYSNAKWDNMEQWWVYNGYMMRL